MGWWHHTSEDRSQSEHPGTGDGIASPGRDMLQESCSCCRHRGTRKGPWPIPGEPGRERVAAMETQALWTAVAWHRRGAHGSRSWDLTPTATAALRYKATAGDPRMWWHLHPWVPNHAGTGDWGAAGSTGGTITPIRASSHGTPHILPEQWAPSHGKIFLPPSRMSAAGKGRGAPFPGTCFLLLLSCRLPPFCHKHGNYRLRLHRPGRRARGRQA